MAAMGKIARFESEFYYRVYFFSLRILELEIVILRIIEFFFRIGIARFSSKSPFNLRIEHENRGLSDKLRWSILEFEYFKTARVQHFQNNSLLFISYRSMMKPKGSKS